MSQRRAHYVLSSHWDREWYQTFQDFRYRLVRLLDRILEGQEDGRLLGPFTTDGQAVMIEDYLEIRPERREEVERAVAEGRLVVGPWYVLPDEFLVSGESLVRNIRLGRQRARDYGGEPSSSGFVCDLFGHCSQMPQILRGFDVRYGFIWRGVDILDTAHLLWEGADGTALPCYRFGEVGYCDYATKVRRAFDGNDRSTHEERLERVRDFLKAESARSDAAAPLLLFDGGDHQEWDQAVYEALREVMDSDAEEFEIVHSSLDAWSKDMLASGFEPERRIRGELRDPSGDPTSNDQQWLIPGVASSRVWIKQQNAGCEALLCSWAEPMGLWAARALDDEYPDGYLDAAWRWLLKNQPHDSICGCSIDAVHEDMKFRFSQSRGIAERLTLEATRRLAAAVEGDVDDDAVRIVVFNPAPVPFERRAELVLEVPEDWPQFQEFFGYEQKPAFRVFDANGSELPFQVIAQARGRSKKRLPAHRFPQGYRTNDVTVTLPLSIPAMGYTTLMLRRPEKPGAVRHPDRPPIATSERSLENEHLALRVESNGTVTLSDKRSGRVMERLLTFESVADIGDGWYHGQALNDEAWVSTASSADVAVTAAGPQVGELRVRTRMHAPAGFDFANGTRASEHNALVIDTRLRLRAGDDWVEAETTVVNNVENHRLRAIFPSGAARAATCLADSAFDVVERPIALDPENHLRRELEVETRPQRTWTAVYDEDGGLAVVSEGLLETAVRDLPERPMALTLYRSTHRTVMTDGEPEGQLLGHALRFRYRLVPLSGAPDVVRLCQMGQEIAAGLRAAQLRGIDIELYRDSRQHWGPRPKPGAQAASPDAASSRRLPATAEFLRIQGPAILTSARDVDGAAEIRIFNPTTEAGIVTLTFGGPGDTPTSATPVNLESTPLAEALVVRDGEVETRLAPKQIMTLRVR